MYTFKSTDDETHMVQACIVPILYTEWLTNQPHPSFFFDNKVIQNLILRFIKPTDKNFFF